MIQFFKDLFSCYVDYDRYGLPRKNHKMHFSGKEYTMNTEGRILEINSFEDLPVNINHSELIGIPMHEFGRWMVILYNHLKEEGK